VNSISEKKIQSVHDEVSILKRKTEMEHSTAMTDILHYILNAQTTAEVNNYKLRKQLIDDERAAQMQYIEALKKAKIEAIRRGEEINEKDIQLLESRLHIEKNNARIRFETNTAINKLRQ
jgi:hypothetical protein